MMNPGRLLWQTSCASVAVLCSGCPELCPWGTDSWFVLEPGEECIDQDDLSGRTAIKATPAAGRAPLRVRLEAGEVLSGDGWTAPAISWSWGLPSGVLMEGRVVEYTFLQDTEVTVLVSARAEHGRHGWGEVSLTIAEEECPVWSAPSEVAIADIGPISGLAASSEGPQLWVLTEGALAAVDPDTGAVAGTWELPDEVAEVPFTSLFRDWGTSLWMVDGAGRTIARVNEPTAPGGMDEVDVGQIRTDGESEPLRAVLADPASQLMLAVGADGQVWSMEQRLALLSTHPPWSPLDDLLLLESDTPRGAGMSPQGHIAVVAGERGLWTLRRPGLQRLPLILRSEPCLWPVEGLTGPVALSLDQSRVYFAAGEPSRLFVLERVLP